MISIVVLAYQMQRELPRTLYTLSRAYQRGVDEIEYEVVVVDNGSENPLSCYEIERFGNNFRGVWITRGQYQSPCIPINRSVLSVKGELVGVLIDGARMVTPGLIKTVNSALKIDRNSVASVMSWHLGSQPQSIAMTAGYSQSIEDELLRTVNWRENGYKLYDIACFAPSSTNGYFGSISESNAIFLSKENYVRMGGYDERFILPGGGFANLDFYKRLMELPGVSPVRIMGEGTFHQIHGGVATNDQTGLYVKSAVEEYVEIKGCMYVPPNVETTLFGSLTKEAMRGMVQSVEKWKSRQDNE